MSIRIRLFVVSSSTFDAASDTWTQQHSVNFRLAERIQGRGEGLTLSLSGAILVRISPSSFLSTASHPTHARTLSTLFFAAECRLFLFSSWERVAAAYTPRVVS